MKAKLAEALMMLIAVAVVARVIWTLLGPLLPTAIGLLVVVSVFYFLLRRR